MKNRIVTISREFGSGGRTVGRLLADRLGIPCYDSDLIEKIAIEKGFSGIEDEWETDKGLKRFVNSSFSSLAFAYSHEDKVWKYQRDIIRDLVDRGSCVIVGRCAEYILRDTADCLTVFIHADPGFRAERIVKEYGSTETEPIQRIRQMDKKRAEFHRYHTGMKWGQAKDYNVCLDSGVLGIEKCVDILRELY